MAEHVLDAQGAGQALGPVLAGYLIGAGRFDLAFAAAGLIGVGVPIIVAGWRGTMAAPSNRQPWQELKRGVAEVGRDRLVLVWRQECVRSQKGAVSCGWGVCSWRVLFLV